MDPVKDQIPLWLDCDPGHDDAFAILLSTHHPQFKLLGISTCYGNAPLSRTTENALRLLEAIGQPHVPVFPGSSKPFCRISQASPDIHGESGLDGTNLLPVPKKEPLKHCNAIVEMKEALLACPPGMAWLVATGTLTNSALLFATFPEVAAHIRGLSIMGGAIGDGFTSAPLGAPFTDSSGQQRSRIGNITPYAEFNIHCDPESAQSIFSNPVLACKTVLITLDLSHQAFATRTVQKALLQGHSNQHNRKPTRLRQMFYELLTFFEYTYAEKFGLNDGPPLHDPLAVAVILSNLCKESLIKFDDRGGERWQVEIDLSSEQLGRTKALPAAEGVIIPRSLDLVRFWEIINQCLESADAATSFDRNW